MGVNQHTCPSRTPSHVVTLYTLPTVLLQTITLLPFSMVGKRRPTTHPPTAPDLKMMNLLALCLVVTSLAGAAVWSPTAVEHQKQNSDHEDYIVKEGHRVVVVEYDKNGKPNTKVSISPEHLHGSFDDGKETNQEAASVLPNFGQGVSQNGREGYPAARELMCDAFGKCKHKIANAMEKVKETISGTAHDDLEMKMQGARDFVSKNKEAAHHVGDVVDKAKEKISTKAHDVGKGAKETLKKAKDAATTLKDTSKTLRVDVVGNVSNEVVQKTRETTEAAKDTAKKVAAGADKVAKESKKGLSQIVKIGRKVANTRLDETLNPFMSIVNLLGLATAYGTCVWITFVSSYVLSRALPRQQFGMVQSKIYPVYFRAMANGIGMALVGHVFGQRKRIFTSKSEMLQVYNLFMSLLTVFVNSMYLEPKATRAMFERMKMEKEEGRGRSEVVRSEPNDQTADHHPADQDQLGDDVSKEKTDAFEAKSRQLGGGEQEAVIRSRITRLNEKLKKLNSYSSLLNILTLMSLSWHLVYMSQQLHHINPINPINS